jgi:ABC-type glycerol-3-phosphate transport system substrate-binding protein
MNRKFFALIIVFALMLQMLSLAAYAQDDEVVLRALIRPDEGENVALYAQLFEEETGIKVEVDFVGWAEIYNKTVTTLAAGGGGYDIVFVPSANAVEFASGGWFAPIDSAIPDDERGDWLESVVDLYTYDGSLIAMPWYAGGAHFISNAANLEGAGVDPASIAAWDEGAAAGGALIEAGSPG